jgi:hypothetical protein
MKVYFYQTCVCLLYILCSSAFAQEKHRLLVLTDIENEPDDAQSMVRLLLYSNTIDIEGLVATTSTHLRDKTAEWRIKEIVTAYGKVRENLLLHEPDFPREESLHSITKKGVPLYGMSGVGAGHDSEGSDWLIQMVDKEDNRPLWVSVWGGANVLAQALFKVRETRSKEELNEFVSKIRVYTISDQDDSGPWIRKEFPALFYIVSPGENYLHATWSGISGERWYKFASGVDITKILNPWLRENIIENHGPLGAQYPPIEYAMEGDTPSFIGLIPNGLNEPERPHFGGWGGRYELYTPRYLPYRHRTSLVAESRPIWTDAKDEVVGNDGRVYIDNHATIWRWRDAYQNDFAARMDWTVMTPEKANHPPMPQLNGPREVTVKVGEKITLDASASTDPDRDSLQYQWIHYPEPGNYWYYHWIPLKLENMNTAVMTLEVDKRVQISEPLTTHIILQVTDQGEPALTRYERVIVRITTAE